MSTYPWGEDPLQYLIGDMPAADFFADYHEQTALHCTHGSGLHYAELLTLARIDEIIASTELPPASVQMARSDPPITRSNFTFANGNIDRGALIRHFQQGATIILPQLHLADALLASFCNALEKVFSIPVQTNIYLTPPGNQGFNTHYDDHDVFVLQISGSKRWKLYEKPIENPYRGENFRPNVFAAGEPKHEFLLAAGDCVYIPRGLMHDAVCEGESPSLHITVGMIVKNWADLMLEALSEVALRDPRFRRSLPPGFARADFDRSDAEGYFKQLIESFKENADFEEVFELFIENFIRGRGANVGGALLSSAAARHDETRYRRRAETQLLFRHDQEAIIICGGGDIHFDKEAVPGLEVAVAGAEFNASAFTGLSKQQAIDVIDKLIAFGVIEEV